MTDAAASSTDSVMLAAGGTGGHLFPAFALAQELKRRGIIVDLITDMRGDKYGSDFPARQIYRVPAATLASKNPIAAAKTGLTLVRGVQAAFKLLGEVRPKAVVGFGGYPTFPPLMAARLRRIPSALHEQNAVLGRANKMLAKRVTAIATSFENVIGLDDAALAKTRFTGNPVRDVVIDWSSRPYRVPGPVGPFSILVFGGSQGARFFSDTVPPALATLPDQIRRELFVVQQARAEDVQRVEAAYASAGIRAIVASFFANLPEEMSKASLVIGRAGASTVAELTVMGRPAILVPLPHALDNDQLNNAKRLAASGGAWVLEQKDITVDSLTAAVQQLLTDPTSLANAAANAKNQGRPDAVIRLADLVEALMGRRVGA
jgi:UDP-N-acetylglucosamine--N-acetylmuramyl-(pentapeptide) pyrophosphoryl-undecaprenol N-acetylglucosamine transferase